MASARYDEYWRLSDYHRTTVDQLRHRLERKGYLIKKSASKAELIVITHRDDCGQFCYDNCTETELSLFARDRGISLACAKAKSTRAARLINADSERTFRRLLDLPAELRNRIYHYYIADFPHLLTLPAAPPLARTCKQVEKEVLPLFYSTKTFHVIFERRALSFTKNALEFKATDKTALFLRELSRESMSEIRSLCISLRTWWRKTNQDHDSRVISSLDVRFVGDTGYKLTVAGDMDEKAPKAKKMRRELHEAVAKVRHVIAARDGRKKLRVEDVYALRKVAEEVFG
ncbi:hypothetical protein LTR85_006699 [Meristemomyces frigidus]|nr:hypothetical protein LTR85_006699 [Meristemomyces frigidus]